MSYNKGIAKVEKAQYQIFMGKFIYFVHNILDFADMMSEMI